MKALNKFIIEKLRLNKNFKLQTNELSNKIFFDYWCFSDDNEKIQSIISDWIDKNQVSDVYPVASLETLNELKYLLNKDIIDEYNTNNNEIENCAEYLENAETLFEYKMRGEQFTIMGCKEMICILGWYGGLYCVKE